MLALSTFAYCCGMWTTNRLISVVFILVSAVACLAASEEPVSFKLVQTLNDAELASSAPFNQQGLLAVRVGDVVQLWDTRTGQLRVSLAGQRKLLETIFSVDGATFITCGKEKSGELTTRLWDAQTGRLKTTLSGIVVYGPAGSEIVTLADHDDLKFWNAETGELIKTVHSYKGTFSDSRISLDGRVVVRYGHRPPRHRPALVPGKDLKEPPTAVGGIGRDKSIFFCDNTLAQERPPKRD